MFVLEPSEQPFAQTRPALSDALVEERFCKRPAYRFEFKQIKPGTRREAEAAVLPERSRGRLTVRVTHVV